MDDLYSVEIVDAPASVVFVGEFAKAVERMKAFQQNRRVQMKPAGYAEMIAYGDRLADSVHQARETAANASSRMGPQRRREAVAEENALNAYHAMCRDRGVDLHAIKGTALATDCETVAQNIHADFVARAVASGRPIEQLVVHIAAMAIQGVTVTDPTLARDLCNAAMSRAAPCAGPEARRRADVTIAEIAEKATRQAASA